MHSPTVQPPDNAALLAASRLGQVDAFGTLVERYQNLVCAVAYSRTGDRALSEDVAQETFLTAWRRLDTLRQPDRLPSWLLGIARNLSSKARRKHRREHLGEDPVDGADADSTQASPLDALLSRETDSALWAALARLSPTYREALILFYREERSVAEVAGGLGLSEAAARQRLSRGRAALAAALSEREEHALEAGRLGKSFTGVVVAAVAATVAAGSASAVVSAAAAASAASSVSSSSAAPSSSAAGATPTWLASRAVRTAGLGLLTALAVATVVVAVHESHRAASRAAPPPRRGAHDQRVLATLRHRRASLLAQGAGRNQPCDMGGTVLDDAGRPVAGAMVAVVDSTAMTLPDPAIARTDADGHWSLGARPPGRYAVAVTAPGHMAQSRPVRCKDARLDSRDVRLANGGTRLTGVVTDIGGGPVAGVAIRLQAELSTSHVYAARTGADGHYAIEVPPGLYTELLVHPRAGRHRPGPRASLRRPRGCRRRPLGRGGDPGQPGGAGGPAPGRSGGLGRPDGGGGRGRPGPAARRHAITQRALAFEGPAGDLDRRARRAQVAPRGAGAGLSARPSDRHSRAVRVMPAAQARISLRYLMRWGWSASSPRRRRRSAS